MSRETKIGLLVGLFVILTFAAILHMRLAGEQQIADLGNENEGVHVTQVGPIEGHGPGEAEAVAGRETDESDDDRLADRGTEETEESESSDSNEYTGMFVVRPESHLSETEREQAAEGETDRETEVQDQPQEAPQFYRVVAGDTLYGIAEKTFGSGKGPQWRRIAEANPALSDPSRLPLGMRIVIPRLQMPQRPAPDVAEEATTIADSGTTSPRDYVVKPGDTLGEISMAVYGTSRKWRMIREANDNLDPRALRPGLKLVIPQVQAGPAVVQSDRRVIERALEEVSEFVADSSRPADVYRVKRGETLYAIARRILGDGKRWKEIYELNRRQMSAPEDLAAGQKILVPSLDQVAMVGLSQH